MIFEKHGNKFKLELVSHISETSQKQVESKTVEFHILLQNKSTGLRESLVRNLTLWEKGKWEMRQLRCQLTLMSETILTKLFS